jgi:hypothetical protein
MWALKLIYRDGREDTPLFATTLLPQHTTHRLLLYFGGERGGGGSQFFIFIMSQHRPLLQYSLDPSPHYCILDPQIAKKRNQNTKIILLSTLVTRRGEFFLQHFSPESERGLVHTT